ncbi:MAG: AAA family ATPase [Proteobacteria bacterium]|uniref:AAA family ATPase n=1 Tax=Candidatus Avisuccinivibrio stercorigallinarum TaxID=2840704 RepID=A0A9D9GSU5_9GAMM|nr:AAA family ATPase [Candidatus Avisuccinivibrio stercorigallinarum]
MTSAATTDAKCEALSAALLKGLIRQKLYDQDENGITNIYSTSPRKSRAEKIYVDHTDLLCELASEKEPCIICRPAGFGLGAVCDDLYALFSGKGDFAGLKAANRQAEFSGHTVVRLDLSRIYRWNNGHLSFISKFDADTFYKEMSRYTREISNALGNYLKIEPESHLPPDEVFLQLCDALKGDNNVLIVENVDAPLFYSRYNLRTMRQVEHLLQDFFVRALRSCRGKFKFILLTARINFNPFWKCTLPLKDLSQDPKYALLAGFTEDDLRKYFDPELRLTAARKFKLHPDDVSERDLSKLLSFFADEFGHYCFAPGAEQVYWPRELCNCMRTGRVKSKKSWYGAKDEDAQLALFLGKEGRREAKTMLNIDERVTGDPAAVNPELFIDCQRLSQEPQVPPSGTVNRFTLLQAAGCLTISPAVTHLDDPMQYCIPNNYARSRLLALTGSKK